LFDWDFMFDPPSGHDEECTCERCHESHLEDGDPQESKHFCQACEDWVEDQISRGLLCMAHGTAYMNEGKCLECEGETVGRT
jgi:hypothetical protein